MINSIFRIINLAAVTGIGWYLFKRFGLPFISAQIEQDKRHRENLNVEHHELKELQQNLDLQIVQQEKVCAELLEKVAQWNQKVIEEQQKQEIEYNELYQKVEQRRKKQHDTYSMALAIEQVKVKVEEQLETELKAYFGDKKAANTYINNIIYKIKKKT